MTGSCPAAMPLDAALLDMLFCGDGAFLRARYRIGLAPAGLTPAELAARCGELVAEYAGCYPGAPRAAVVSQWSVDALMVLLAPHLAALAAGWALELEEVRLMLEHGAPATLACAGGAVSPLACAAGRVRELIERELAPLWRALATAGRVAPRLLWSNTAAALDVAFDYFPPPDADALRARLFDARQWPDGVANPLAGQLRRAPGEAAERRLCCLSHQLGAGCEHCSNCPLV